PARSRPGRRRRRSSGAGTCARRRYKPWKRREFGRGDGDRRRSRREATPGARTPQATLRHTAGIAYGCSRQGLTRFTSFRCRGPTDATPETAPRRLLGFRTTTGQLEKGEEAIIGGRAGLSRSGRAAAGFVFRRLAL